jgi:hypothetical protein
MRSLWKQGNALFRQKFTNWQCCVCVCVCVRARARCRDEGSNRVQFPFELASPSFSDGSGLQDNIFDSLWHQAVRILYELPHENKKDDDHCLDFWFAHANFLLSWRLWRVPFFTLPLDFRVMFENLSFITYYEPIKKICFIFEPFKHLYRHFVSTPFLIVIQIFWNQLWIHFPHVQILCNSLVDLTFINVKFISDHLNCQTSILTNESPHRVEVCACSHRRGASRACFIFRRFSPIYKVFVPPKYLSTWYGIITKRFLNLLVWIGSALTQPDTKLDGITLLDIIILRFCDAVTKHTSTRIGTEPHIFILASSNLE